MSRKPQAAKKDASIAKIRTVLAKYEATHPKAKVDIHRQNDAVIRIRIIDPDFKDMDRVDRDSEVWRFLDELPADILGEIYLLLLLTPQETAKSFANMEFESPIPSRL
jgi:stress-induced morphogen